NLDRVGDAIEVAGAVSTLATFDATGTTSVEVAAVSTSGSQTYTGATTLNGDITSTNGPITFNDAVTVTAATLVVDSGAGNLAFMDTVQGQAGTENLDLFGNDVDVQGAISNLATLDVLSTDRKSVGQ